MNLRASVCVLTKPDGTTERGLAVVRRAEPGHHESVAVVLDHAGNIISFPEGYKLMEFAPEDGCFEFSSDPPFDWGAFQQLRKAS